MQIQLSFLSQKWMLKLFQQRPRNETMSLSIVSFTLVWQLHKKLQQNLLLAPAPSGHEQFGPIIFSTVFEEQKRSFYF